MENLKHVLFEDLISHRTLVHRFFKVAFSWELCTFTRAFLITNKILFPVHPF